MGTDKRISIRHVVSIPAVVSGVLASGAATIVDVSTTGAKIQGITFGKGATVWIDLDGETVYGEVAWSEEDRFGMRFTTPSTRLMERVLRETVPPRANSPLRVVRHATFGRRLAA